MHSENPPFDGFYENSLRLPLLRRIQVTEIDLLPVGCITAKVLMSLASKLQKLERWHRMHGGDNKSNPCLRLLQGSREGRITALVQSGNMTLKLSLRRNSSSTGEDEWVVLGDALKVSD